MPTTVSYVSTARIQRMAAAEANNINKSILVSINIEDFGQYGGGHYQQTAQNLFAIYTTS